MGDNQQQYDPNYDVLNEDQLQAEVYRNCDEMLENIAKLKEAKLRGDSDTASLIFSLEGYSKILVDITKEMVSRINRERFSSDDISDIVHEYTASLSSLRLIPYRLSKLPEQGKIDHLDLLDLAEKYIAILQDSFIVGNLNYLTSEDNTEKLDIRSIFFRRARGLVSVFGIDPKVEALEISKLRINPFHLSISLSTILENIHKADGTVVSLKILDRIDLAYNLIAMAIEKKQLDLKYLSKFVDNSGSDYIILALSDDGKGVPKYGEFGYLNPESSTSGTGFYRINRYDGVVGFVLNTADCNGVEGTTGATTFLVLETLNNKKSRGGQSPTAVLLPEN
ncbi:MAG: hypothetical protein Q9M91_01955 [Candidatus Dojkabacteria bacterium]|nr:hypothetical protein [Candidatus Dojkabacteria bacterium]MDQ7020588.1 hypothetical protein [Candidatus Dojkabacteria bacterium]